MDQAVLYHMQDHVSTITYNRPKKGNAVNGAMRRGLNSAWSKFRDDEDAWVAIMTASDPHFCVGADLKDVAGSVGKFKGTFFEKPTRNSFESGWEIFKPTIAAVNGKCVGYGLTAVAMCDFVIASDRATFSYPEVKVGMPTIVGSIVLPPKIGWTNAMELLMIGEPINAHRAKELGLVWKVVPHNKLMKEANTLAKRLCNAPLAVRAVKEVATRTSNMGWTESVRFGESIRRIVQELDGKEDYREGLKSFREKRMPVWGGKKKKNQSKNNQTQKAKL